MKSFILLCLILTGFSASAQFTGDCGAFFGATDGVGIDSNNFENINTQHFYLKIDTADHTNAWAFGSVAKSGFPGAHSGTRALQTDTTQPYAANLSSSVFVGRDTVGYPFFYPDNYYALSFWHYYNVDSLTDSCLVQVTTDSGKTWKNINNYVFNVAPEVVYTGSLSNTAFDPNHTHMILFTGSSTGWVQEHICLYTPGVKTTNVTPLRIGFGYRFLFKSDGVVTGKPGWMVDDIKIMTGVQGAGAVEQLSKNPLSIYPNPSTGIFQISYPEHYVKGIISFYDLWGRKCKELPLQKTIDIRDMPPGIYNYRATFSNQAFSGRIVKE